MNIIISVPLNFQDASFTMFTIFFIILVTVYNASRIQKFLREICNTWLFLQPSWARFKFLRLIRRRRTSDFPATRSKNSLALFHAKKNCRYQSARSCFRSVEGLICRGRVQKKWRRDTYARPLYQNQNSERKAKDKERITQIGNIFL